MENNEGDHVCTLQLMASPDKKSLVIIYQWVNNLAKLYSDKEEAFYIDGVNDDNYESAKSIFIDVFTEMKAAYDANPNTEFEMASCVEGVLQKYRGMAK